MMRTKRIISLVVTILLCVSMLSSIEIFTSAGTYEIWEYFDNWDDTITITNCDKNATGDITVPSMIEGKSVTGLRVSAEGVSPFADCTKITSVFIPETLTEIQGIMFCGLFYNCILLNEVIVAENNPTYSSAGGCLIDNNTDTLLWGNQNSEIPKGVRTIGRFAFQNCELLTSIDFPTTVSEIEYGAFAGCKYLNGIDCNYLNYTFFSSGNCLIEKETNQVILGGCNVIIPETVTGIGDGAFWGRNISHIWLPDNIKYVGSSAFRDCTKLETINMPSAIEGLNVYTFSNCISLYAEYCCNKLTGHKCIKNEHNKSNIGLQD